MNLYFALTIFGFNEDEATLKFQGPVLTALQNINDGTNENLWFQDREGAQQLHWEKIHSGKASCNS